MPVLDMAWGNCGAEDGRKGGEAGGAHVGHVGMGESHSMFLKISVDSSSEPKWINYVIHGSFNQ